jgi:uncharacterized coiled-coil protein SlyX
MAVSVPTQVEHDALDVRVQTLEAQPAPSPDLSAEVTQLQADMTKLQAAIQALVTSWTA